MLIADLKGKLTLAEELSEDFLTSSVFSVFRYLDEGWIEKFLNQAVNIKNEKLRVKIVNPSYNFWPWHANDQKFGGGAEPDVVICSGENAVIIEAKNYAGKSGVGIISDESCISIEEDESKIIIDQLGREYFIGLNKILDSDYEKDDQIHTIKKFYIIFLTRHSIFPEYEISETINSIVNMSPKEKNNAENCIYWLNWQKAIPILEEIVSLNPKNSFEHNICSELIEFLERRNLGVFSGFRFLNDYISFLNELEKIEIKDFFFYQKTFKDYWDYLAKFKSSMNIQINYVFYKKIDLPYWEFLKTDFNINLDKKIFYEG